MSKPCGRNNGKIITRNQGGGNKLQGLAPMSTHYFMAKSTGQSYYTETGDGRNRNLVLCVNQLGGVGRGRSQFRANADGKRGAGCNDDIFTLIYSYTGLPLSINFLGNYFILVNFNDFSDNTITNINTYDAITNTHNSINLFQLQPIYFNLYNILNSNYNGIDLPILSDKIYMLDLNNSDNQDIYTSDASYINIYNSRTFNKHDNSYSIYKPDIIHSTDFSNNNINPLNLYYTNSTTKLGYWYIDTSENIRYNTNIEATDISNINFTSDNDMSLNNFYVCAFDNNFAFTDMSENLIIYLNGINPINSINVIAIPIVNVINNYGSHSNANFITQGQYRGTLVIMILDRRIENVLQIFRITTTQFYSFLTIPIRNSLYNSLISNSQNNQLHIQKNKQIQQLLYNISPNGQYLGLFNNLGFLEIYKFDGTGYNLHRRKTDINFFNPNILTTINSISNDGTIVSVTRLIVIIVNGSHNPISAFVQIYRLN